MKTNTKRTDMKQLRASRFPRVKRLWDAVLCSRRSLLWVLLMIPALAWGGMWPWVWLFSLVLVLIVDLPVHIPFYCDGVLTVADLTSDWGLWPLVILSPFEDVDMWSDRKRRRNGNRLVRRLGLVSGDDSHDYRVWWYPEELTLLVREGLGPNLSPSQLEPVLVSKAPLLDCVDATVTGINGVCCTARFHKHPRWQALAGARRIGMLPAPSTQDNGIAVPIGRDLEGDHCLQLRNVPGLCVGGASRSGKTKAVCMLAASLQHFGFASVSVIDCKGGGDFTNALSSSVPSLEMLGARVLADRGDEDFLQQAKDMLDREVEDMRARQYALDRSFWDLTANRRPPLRLLIIDECQELWAMKGRTKAETELLKAIQRNILTLIRVGASAGWCTVLCSQDWTSDVIDTSVRSQLMRIAFWSAESSKTQAILGCSNETMKRMNFDGMDRAAWRGMSIINDGDKPDWVRWDFLA